jgi:transposase
MSEAYPRSTSATPFNIAQQKGNKFTVNLWSYRELMNIIELKAQDAVFVCLRSLSIIRPSTVLIMVFKLRGGRGE